MSHNDYTNSRNSKIYEQIAKMCDSTPEHVYELAHGKSSTSHIDDIILDELKREGIVSLRQKKVRKKRRSKKKIRNIIFYILLAVAIGILVFAFTAYNSNAEKEAIPDTQVETVNI